MKCGDRDPKHNAEMASRQLYWELLEELKCPVCLMYMAFPIRMCENGHNICSSCKEHLTHCPTCRGKFVNVRNITLEKLAASAIYPCKNREGGCEETFTADNRDSHLAVCLFQSRECPFRKLSGVDCPWTGTLPDIVVHIRGEHDSETVEMSAHFRVELLDFVEGSRYRRVVICLGELFYLTWERKGAILCFGVFHFGPKNETTDFKYGIKIGSSAAYDAATRKCHNYLDGDLAQLQLRDCVTFNYNRIQDYLNANGYLSCEIEIGRDKIDGFVSEELQEGLSFASAIGSEIVIGREMLGRSPPPGQPPIPTTTLSTQPLPQTYLQHEPVRTSAFTFGTHSSRSVHPNPNFGRTFGHRVLRN
jgi:hypothetical protein